jgi:hypothetical protein
MAKNLMHIGALTNRIRMKYWPKGKIVNSMRQGAAGRSSKLFRDSHLKAWDWVVAWFTAVQ